MIFMKKKKPQLPGEIPFYDHQSTSEYEAIYKNGAFTDSQTGKLIKVKESARVRIIVPNMYIDENDIEQHLKTQSKVIFKPGAIFYFDLPHKSSTPYRFNIVSIKSISAVKKGNKRTELINSECEITGAIDLRTGSPLKNFQPFSAVSFNNAFTQASVKYRPATNSHTCNIYKTFFTAEDKMLDFIRERVFGY